MMNVENISLRSFFGSLSKLSLAKYVLLGTRGGLLQEKRERETTGSRHARGKPAST